MKLFLPPVLAFLLLHVAAGLSAQPDPDFHIYLSIGQSNMEGQGAISDADLSDINPRYLTLSATDYPQRLRARGQWYPAMPPLCREDLVYDNPAYRGLGPTDYFGRTMVDATPENVRIGVVCVAVGAAKIEGFFRDTTVAQDYYNHQCKDYVREKFAMYDYYGYGHLLALARQAQQVGVIRGILLHQGESNYGETDWPLKVKQVYDNLLADLGLEAEQVPLLVGEVTEGGPSASMNNIIRTVPDYIPTAHVISSVGAAKKSWDPIHFDAEGYREMGRRYARKMLELEGYDATGLQPLIATAKDLLNYSTASGGQRLALQNAITQALTPTSEGGRGEADARADLTTAIHNYTTGGAKPLPGHPFDLTWMGSTATANWSGATGTYRFTRLGLSPEFYTSDTGRQGVVMHQVLKSMPDGTYDIVLHASSSFTSGRGFTSPVTTEGGEHRTYVYANDVAQMVPVRDVADTLVCEPHTYVLCGVRVEGGTLDIGLRHDQAGANWDVIQLRRIALTASPDDHTTLADELRAAQSRAALFAASPLLPETFRQSLATQSTAEVDALRPASELQSALSRLQTDLEAATHVSMATRRCQLTQQTAQALADVPYFEEFPQLEARAQFDQCLATTRSQLSQATTPAAVRDAHAALQQGMYDYIANVCPAAGHQFDLTYLLLNPDLNPFVSGAKVAGWTTDQPDGTLQCSSDASVISADGRQTFCQYKAGTQPLAAGFAVCQQPLRLPAGYYRATTLAFATTGKPTVRPVVTFRAGDTDGQLVQSSTLTAARVDFSLAEEQTLQLGLYSHAGNRATRMGIGYMQLSKQPSPVATGIVEVNSEKLKAKSGDAAPFGLAPVFNLQGQRIADSLDTLHGYRGIVVVRGKKMYIK